MTTAQIEEAADPGSQLATADIDLKFLLRHKVIPDFYELVGYPFWRRKRITVSFAAGATYFDAPTQDVGHIRQLFLSPNLDVPLRYIGDKEEEVQAALIATVAEVPNAYWQEWIDNIGGPRMRFYFSAPALSAGSILLSYDEHIYFSDDTTSVNLNQYIPFQFHWCLVELLKRELYERRFGNGDTRYQRADAEAQRLIAQVTENLEGGRGQRAVYIQ